MNALIAVGLGIVLGNNPLLGQGRDSAASLDTPSSEARHAQVNAVLDTWHQAAAKADEEGYFKHFTADAVFLGTDATERWARDEFRKWAKPYFAKGKAWSFKATRRHVAFSRDGTVAWFDEVLDTPNLGPARGSGVLMWDGATWKIAQYNLSVPIPNDAFADVKKLIEAASKAKPK
jgi:ketosteroid isomerase-like protein